MNSPVLVTSKQTPTIATALGSSSIFKLPKARLPNLVPHFDAFASKNPWLGQKVGAVQNLLGGFAQQFQAATVYGVFGGEPFEVHGAIRAKYLQLNGPAGLLGFPTTNETATPDGQGRFNHFQHGSIYWHPSLGAFEVHGAIRDKWASLGWEAYGYPITDETGALDGAGRFNHFRSFLPDGSTADASIYWHPAIGAHEVHGAIRTAWSDRGWEMSFLGYPVSDEYDVDGGRRSDFQNGSIAWTTALGAQVQPERLVIDAPNITFETGIAIGGYGRLEVFSDGTTHFWGHLHNSGAYPFDCLAVFSLKDTDGHAYAAAQSGTAHGVEPGSRNWDWDEWGVNDAIRGNWQKIRSAHTGGYHLEVTSDWSLDAIWRFVKEIVGDVADYIDLSGGGSEQSDDPNYGSPDDYPEGGLAPSESGIQTISY